MFDIFIIDIFFDLLENERDKLEIGGKIAIRLFFFDLLEIERDKLEIGIRLCFSLFY